MEKIIGKKDVLHRAIVSLHKAIEQYQKATALAHCSGFCQEIFYDKTELIRTTRDSMIQRFEYSIDTLWKYLKSYCEDIEKITIESKSPRGIFKQLCNARVLSEQETEVALEMLDARNATSHMYKEEQAEALAQKITSYYHVLAQIERKITIH